MGSLSLFVALNVAFITGEGETKDYTNVPLGDIGVRTVDPRRDAKTGFVIGGKNATELIRKLPEVNGRSIAELEADMRPGAPSEVGSGKGFLGKDENLLDVLVMDNAYVVDKLGLTHQDLARPLHAAAAIGYADRFNEKGVTFRYHGHEYHVKMICYKGAQLSPFLDKTLTTCDAIVENRTTGKKMKYSPLVPHMIERYGFYEGRGTPYRIEPAEVLELFPHLKQKAKK